jgi:hypothetical protein
MEQKLGCSMQFQAIPIFFNLLNPGEVTPTHYFYEVAWGIS